MKREYKSKKMFIFIVSLLFVLLAFTIIGLADEREITTPDNVDPSPMIGLKEELLKKVIPFYVEVKSTDLVTSTTTIDADPVAAVTMDTAPSSGSGGSSGTSSTSDNEGSRTTDTSENLDENNGIDSEPDLVVATPKSIKKNFADAIFISIPKKLNIDAPDRALPGVEIEATVTSGGEPAEGAIVKLVGESLTNGEGVALVKVPNLENEKLILSASKEGYVSSLKYILITEEEMTSDNQLRFTNPKPQNEEISILPYFLEKTWKYQWMTTFNTKN